MNIEYIYMAYIYSTKHNCRYFHSNTISFIKIIKIVIWINKHNYSRWFLVTTVDTKFIHVNFAQNGAKLNIFSRHLQDSYYNTYCLKYVGYAVNIFNKDKVFLFVNIYLNIDTKY